jgi:hypothetical protein
MPTENNPATTESGQKWRGGFWALIAMQLQSAFNENGLKNLVIFLILAMGVAKEDRDWLVFLVGAMFSLPFILFSMTGGYLAGIHQKGAGDAARDQRKKCSQLQDAISPRQQLARQQFRQQSVF